MDEVPMPLKPALQSPYPSDEEVVRRIRETIALRPDWMTNQPQMIEAQI